MKNKILKTTFALSLACFSFLCVVKNENNKKPIIMKQMACAIESVEDEERVEFETATLEETSQEVELDDATEEEATENDDEEVATEDGIETENEDVLQGGGGDSSSVIEYDGQDFSIMVFGNAHISAKPDKAIILARIETFETDISLSKENNLSVFNNVVSAVEGKENSDKAVELEYFNCQPYYDYSNGRSLQGYHSTSSFSVEVPATAQVEEYIDLLTETGVTSIDSVRYEVSNLEGQYSEALSQAVENARSKAEKMVGGESLTLVKLKEKYVSSTNNFMRKLSLAERSDAFAGKVEIDAQVVAIFER